MAPRWSPGSAVRKEDQFTAAPDFIDPHDSEHLPLWGRLEASWHGMAPQRRVLVASSLAVFAGALGALAILAFVLPSADQGPGQTGQGLAAQPDDSLPVPSVPEVPQVPDAADAVALNSTSPAPLPQVPSVP